MAFQVEAFISGTPYKERRFETRVEAEAYKAELHAQGHYCVALFDLETADRKVHGTRINWPLDDPRSRPWATAQ